MATAITIPTANPITAPSAILTPKLIAALNHSALPPRRRSKLTPEAPWVSLQAMLAATLLAALVLCIATEAASAAPPANSAPPSISGNPQEGGMLTAALGGWSGTQPIGYAYQWRRCDAAGANCVDIVGATTQTYVLTANEVGRTSRVMVTASNAEASSSATSTQTAVVTAVPSPVIAAAGDIACDPNSVAFNGGLGTPTSCHQRYTSDLLVGAGLARVLALGDTQYESGTLTAFGQSYDPTWGRVKSITSPAVGNHEYMTPGAAGYFDYFNGIGSAGGPAGDRTRGYYSYDIGPWHLISLNSNCSEVGGCGAGSAQEQWLRQDLAASNTSCVLAYWHHPLFSSGRYSPGISTVRPLFQALYDYNADVLLTGHDHNYERFAPQDPNGAPNDARGIREFVVGTGGHSHYEQGAPVPNSEVRNSSSYGVLRLTLYSSSFAWQFTSEAAQSFADSGSDTCNGPPIPGNLPSSHVRPLSATPVYVSLVPAFRECTSANRAHGPPLAYGSCAPPATLSPNLTVRVPIGEVHSKGFVRLAAKLGVPGGPDDTDVRLGFSLSHVMRASDFSEYTGELRASVNVRLTDKEGPVSATVQDFPLQFDVPCAPTPDPAEKSLCSLVTDLDAVIPGATPERTRAVWALDQVKVYDGGPDEDAGTEQDNSLFAVQGLFIP